jgi:hypothetical protein
MPRMSLEGHTDIPNVSLALVESGLLRMAAPNGPTYIILSEEDGSYMQAAGTEGRYALEARDAFGEGFLHWRAAKAEVARGVQATIYYHNRCSHGKHAQRTCPITVDAGQVVGCEDVMESLLLFARARERSPSLYWHDVTAELLRREAEKQIGEIRPRNTKGSDNG